MYTIVYTISQNKQFAPSQAFMKQLASDSPAREAKCKADLAAVPVDGNDGNGSRPSHV